MFKNKIKSKNLFILYALILILFTFARNVLLIEISPIFMTLLSTIYLFLSNDNPIELLIFLIPFQSTLQTNYIILIATIIYILKYKNKIIFRKNLVFLILVILIEFFNCLNYYSNLIDFFSFSVIMFLGYLTVFTIGDTNINKIRLLKKYLFGLVSATIIFVISTFNYISVDHFLVYGNRLGDLNEYFVFSQYNLNFNANDLAFYLLLGVSILLVLYENSLIKRINFTILLILFLAFGFLTMSRAFVLSIIITFLLYFILIKTKVKRILQFMFLITIGFFLIFNYFPTLVSGVAENFLDRFVVSDKMGGRTSLLTEYNNVIISNPKNFFIGSGIQNYNLKNGVLEASHNAIQEIIVAWGIVGAFFIILLYYNYYKIQKSKVLKKINYLPMFSFLIMIQSIQFFSSGIKILTWLIIIYTLSIVREDEVDDKKRIS